MEMAIVIAFTGVFLLFILNAWTLHKINQRLERLEHAPFYEQAPFYEIHFTEPRP